MAWYYNLQFIAVSGGSFDVMAFIAAGAAVERLGVAITAVVAINLAPLSRLSTPDGCAVPLLETI
jgi:hypothetical protein